MNNFNEGVGKRIKQQRLALQLSREELAYTVHISNKFLYEIEIGRKGISVQTLAKLAKALGVSADWVLDGDEPSRKPS
jgi:transcriptional regulator with XRE-family HTH domain